MRLSFCLLSICCLLNLTSCAQEIPNKEAQIALAIKAAPDGMREGATVYGFDAANALVKIQEGTGTMVCLADDPQKDGINIACYHRDLEPFMARGRALRAEGKSREEIFDMRENEVKAGTLKMPETNATLHILYGKTATYDATNDSLAGAKYRSVVYIPYATTESTGLPDKPIVPGAAWIMDPGTHRAHIMITPPQEE